MRKMCGEARLELIRRLDKARKLQLFEQIGEEADILEEAIIRGFGDAYNPENGEKKYELIFVAIGN